MGYAANGALLVMIETGIPTGLADVEHFLVAEVKNLNTGTLTQQQDVWLGDAERRNVYFRSAGCSGDMFANIDELILRGRVPGRQWVAKPDGTNEALAARIGAGQGLRAEFEGNGFSFGSVLRVDGSCEDGPPEVVFEWVQLHGTGIMLRDPDWNIPSSVVPTDLQPWFHIHYR